MPTAEEFGFAAPPIWEVGFSVMTAGPLFNPYFVKEIHRLFEDRFPHWERQPPFVGMQPFPSPNTMMMQTVMLQAPDLSRYWLLDPSGANLLQLQENFTARNWRQQSLVERQPYPGFDNLFADFKAQIEILRAWGREAGIELPPPAMCELLYDNLIPLTLGDGEIARMSEIVTALRPVGKVANMAMQWFEQFDPEDTSTQIQDMHVTIQHVGAIALGDGPPSPEKAAPYMKMMFTARSAQQTWENVYAFFERAHAHIRKRLVDLTTERARESWGPNA